MEAKSEAAKGKTKAAAAERRIGWDLVERVLACTRVARIYLFGPPGVGKTWCAIHAAGGGDRVYVVTLTQEMPASELRGTWMPRGQELVWTDGPIVSAMREGALVVINELLNGSDDALAFLHPVLEMPETARLGLPTGEMIAPAPGFRVIVTENRPPSELPAPLRDRFDVLLEVHEPHPKAFEVLSPALREVARRGFALEEERQVSIRRWIVLQLLEPVLGLETACIAVFGLQRGEQVHDAVMLARAKAA